jgi:DNA polymerase-3 subunit epsilon
MRWLGPRQGAAVRYAEAPAPDPETPWRDAEWCALDLELTGLDTRRDAIIAVGAVPIEDGRAVLGKALYTLVRTSRRSADQAVLMHKLRVADLVDAPPIEDATEMVIEVLAGRVPVFHTAIVEQSFLGPLLARRRVRLAAAADTEALGRAWLQARDGAAPVGLPLARLASTLGLPAETPHHALGDALTTAKAFIALATLLDSVAPQTVSSLVAASQPPQTNTARRFGPG